MSGNDLSGIRILVVEDDYYLATDAEKTLTSAGADVFGPCGDEESGLAVAEEEEIDCAILDVNLGPGPSFRIAHAMRERGIPFLFVTGYDREAIPKEFSDVERLEKPYVGHHLLNAVGRLV
jgi:DNA-binding response OmpR family regulator